MFRSAILSWAVILLLAAVLAGYLEFGGLAETAADLAAIALIAVMLVQVLWSMAAVLRQRRPPPQ